MFGDYVKGVRLKLGISLREFCKITGEDPSNWSKIERNLLPAPQDDGRIFRIAQGLGIESPDEISTIKELATVSAGTLPDYIMSNQEVINNLPAFLRTIDNVKPTREEFLDLINKMREKK